MLFSRLSLECIIENLDVNVRIQLSMAFPEFRRLEKSVPLKLKMLRVDPSKVKVNNTTYVFGEIQEIQKSTLSSLRDHEKRFIKRMNRYGGFPWRSLKDDVVELGDVNPPNRDVSFLESQRFEIMEDLRGVFMESLEKYLNDQKVEVNPMDLLEELEDSEYSEFDKKAKEVFEKLGERSVSKIESMRNFFDLVKDGRRTEMDELAEKFPKAFDLMRRKVGEKNLPILEKLVYPQEKILTFNQFTIIEKWNKIKNHHRLPSQITLRQAFKIFNCAIFGSRRNIQVEKIEIEGPGIIGLPVGFKIHLEKMGSRDTEEVKKVYRKIVKNWKSLNIN